MRSNFTIVKVDESSAGPYVILQNGGIINPTPRQAEHLSAGLVVEVEFDGIENTEYKAKNGMMRRGKQLIDARIIKIVGIAEADDAPLTPEFEASLALLKKASVRKPATTAPAV